LWLYAFLLPVIGFVLDTILLMVFLFRVIQKVKWTTAVIVSVIAVASAIPVFFPGNRIPQGFFS